MSPNITIYSIPYHTCLFVYFICWHISVTLRLKIQRDKPTTTFGLTKPHGMCLIKRARKPNTKHGLFYVPNKPSPKPFFTQPQKSRWKIPSYTILYCTIVSATKKILWIFYCIPFFKQRNRNESKSRILLSCCCVVLRACKPWPEAYYNEWPKQLRIVNTTPPWLPINFNENTPNVVALSKCFNSDAPSSQHTTVKKSHARDKNNIVVLNASNKRLIE